MQFAKRRTKKKPRQRMGVRPPVRVRSEAHLKWIRSLACLVNDCAGEPVEPHHVGDTATSGTALKSDDYLTVPLCHHHHIDELHGIGAKWFETEYGLDLRKEALWLAKRSPDIRIKEAVRDG